MSIFLWIEILCTKTSETEIRRYSSANFMFVKFFLSEIGIYSLYLYYHRDLVWRSRNAHHPLQLSIDPPSLLGPCPIVHRTRKTRFFLYRLYYTHYYLPTTPSPINCDCTYSVSCVCVCGMRNLVEHVIYIFGTQFDSARLITGRRGGLIQYVPT